MRVGLNDLWAWFSMCDKESFLSVIVPTYGRAGLLARTLPSYLQPELGELIVVDDCSPDDTAAAVAKIAAVDTRVRYLRSPRNLKQTHAKNMGIAAAKGSLLYFGDDDSMLLPGSLKRLIDTMRESGADIVGASAPYMKDNVALADVEAFANQRSRLEGALVDPVTMHCHFDTDTDTGLWIEAPFVHAAFLCAKTLAQSILFDEGYTGNCYREETDFLVRARAFGARIVYEPRAVQVNLPRGMAGGGAHGGSPGGGRFISRKLRYFREALSNNKRFLKKNGPVLNEILGRSLPSWVRQALFFFDIVRVVASYPFRKAARHAR